MDLTPWQAKMVALDWHDRHFAFDVSQELFSSHAIDQGSLLLLKSLPWSELGWAKRIVDFGCGYGPLGVVAGAAFPDAALTLIDRDALAVAFAAQNVKRNLPDREGSVVCTIGLDLVSAGGEPADVLLWNVPGKAGEPVLRGLCKQLAATLAPCGLAALVVVNPLAEMIRAAIAGEPHLSVVLDSQHTAHTVIHARRDASPAAQDASPDAFASGLFDRAERIVALGDRAYAFRPVYGLPEYDNPDYSSAVAIDLLATVGPVEHCIIHQPGQGHVALATLLRNETRGWTLSGRDLLSLKATARNLTINGAEPADIALSASPEVPRESAPASLLVAMLDDQVGPARVARLVGSLEEVVAAGGLALLAGRSTSVTRVVGAATSGGAFRAGKRVKRHGASAALLRRR